MVTEDSYSSEIPITLVPKKSQDLNEKIDENSDVRKVLVIQKMTN